MSGKTITDPKEANRLKRFGSSERHPFQVPLVEMTTKLPDGTLLTESYRYKKMERHP